MHIIESPEAMARWRSSVRGDIGFVPTMGALHEGHMSLVEASRASHSCTVVSVFVNPTQFGPNEDFHKYPRPVEIDEAMCLSRGVEVLYRPNVETMYPPGFQTLVEPGPMAARWCGASRPGHFRGVCSVVLKLLNQVSPQSIYLGEKDAQQLRVIRRMVSDLNVPVQVTGCPIARERDGLAMSSRNRYLSPSQRIGADALFRGLIAAKLACREGCRHAIDLEAGFRNLLAREGGWECEYAAVVDDDSLEPLQWVESKALFIVAARRGTTRLIDNMMISGPDLAPMPGD
jgi:pantoate--beta-alanine ligase